MNLLKSKLKLVKDIEHEQSACLELTERYKNCLDTLLQDLETVLSPRNNELVHFKTKVGQDLNSNTLQLFNRLTEQINQIFYTAQSVYSSITERQQCLRQLVKYGSPLVEQIQSLNNFMKQTTVKYNSIHLQLTNSKEIFRVSSKPDLLFSFREETAGKEQAEHFECNNVEGERSRRMREDLMAIQKEGKQALSRTAESMNNFQIMKFSYIVDECLNYLSDFGFLVERTRPNIFSSNGQRPSAKGHEKSLGIESNFNEEIDLMCTEDLNLPLPRYEEGPTQDLQRITEREQSLESDHSPGPKYFGSLSLTP